MIKGRNIIFISSIDWDDQWQAPQELALRLTKAGNRILYIENTGIRVPGSRDARRIKRRLKHWAGALLRRRGVRMVLPELGVLGPLVLPPFGAALLSYLNRQLLLRFIGGAARSRRSAYTETVVPSKINEYLAMGKPVVSTDLPQVCEFNNEHQGLITAEERPDSFLQAVEHALSLDDDAAVVARRRAVARQGDWAARLEAMSELILGEHDGVGRGRDARTALDVNDKMEPVA